MRENGEVALEMVKENNIGLMEQVMKENGLSIMHMAMESLYTQMEISMRVSG